MRVSNNALHVFYRNNEPTPFSAKMNNNVVEVPFKYAQHIIKPTSKNEVKWLSGTAAQTNLDEMISLKIKKKGTIEACTEVASRAVARYFIHVNNQLLYEEKSWRNAQIIGGWHVFWANILIAISEYFENANWEFWKSTKSILIVSKIFREYIKCQVKA